MQDGSFFSFNDYRLLASGSDDLHVKIWDLCGKEVHSFNSGHVNNIFSVQFLPSGQGKVIVSAAGMLWAVLVCFFLQEQWIHRQGLGDRSVRMHSYTYSETSHVWYSDGRVKRLAVTAADPHLFWSASEDGIIRSGLPYDRNFNAINGLCEIFSFVKRTVIYFV